MGSTSIPFRHDAMPKEDIRCNLCGGDAFFVLANRASNGHAVRTCLCKECGLVYLNPRMTKEGYDQYYKDFYRADRAHAKGIDAGGYAPLEEGFEGTIRFGEVLARSLSSYIN